jgi:hypothetical protein
LDSIFTHQSDRYALEGALNGFATDAAINALPNHNIIMFSERNSEALDAADNAEFGSINQDDYDSWVGEAALVQWGTGKYGDEGWIRYNRHNSRVTTFTLMATWSACVGLKRGSTSSQIIGCGGLSQTRRIRGWV